MAEKRFRLELIEKRLQELIVKASCCPWMSMTRCWVRSMAERFIKWVILIFGQA